MNRLVGLVVGVVVVLLAGCASGAQDGADPPPTAGASPTGGAGAGEASGTAVPTSAMSIAQVLRADGRFTHLLDIAERSRPTSAVRVWESPAEDIGDDEDGITVFAPTDAAFEALDPTVAAAMEDSDADDFDQQQERRAVLYDVIAHHSVHRLYPSSEFEAGPQETWSNHPWNRRAESNPSAPVELGTDPLTWGGHPVIETDIRAENGYIHVVDGLVLPDDLAEAAEAEME